MRILLLAAVLALTGCSAASDTAEVTPESCLTALDAAEDLLTMDTGVRAAALNGVGEAEDLARVRAYADAADACRGLAATD